MSAVEWLDKLDQVHAKGTADGEWRFVDHRDRFGPDNRYEILDDEGSVAVCSDDNDATETTGLQRVDLIVAAVNALPKLTAAVRAVLAIHSDWCPDCSDSYPCPTVGAIVDNLVVPS